MSEHITKELLRQIALERENIEKIRAIRRRLVSEENQCEERLNWMLGQLPYWDEWRETASEGETIFWADKYERLMYRKEHFGCCAVERSARSSQMGAEAFRIELATWEINISSLDSLSAF